ncbi:MAG: DUF4175 family protein, partial [Pirellulaceae bacterium]
MSSLTMDRDLSRVPQPIVKKLQALIRRARLVAVVRGLLAVIAATLGALLVAMAVDATITIFSSTGRWVLSLAALASVLATGYWFLIRPLARTFTLQGIARLIETRHPELEERLSSAVELLSSPDAPELKGSELMIAELAKEATGQATIVVPEREFSFDTVRKYLVAVLSTAALLLFAWVLWPESTSRLVNRIMVPFADIGNVRETDMVIIPQDIVLARGDSLRVEVTVKDDRVRSARLLRHQGSQSESSDRMIDMSADADGNPRFSFSLPVVDEGFRYRVHAGGGLSRFYKVTVVPRPEVEQLEVEYQYPAYTGQGTRKDDKFEGRIEGLIGTQVTVTAHSNTKLKVARLQVDGLPPQNGKITTAKESKQSVCRWQVALTREMIGGRVWTLRLEDKHGFVSWPQEYTIRAIKDQPPEVKIVKPLAKRLEMKSTDSLPLSYLATDDYGVAQVELLTTTDGKERAPLKVALPDSLDPAYVEANHPFNLSQFDLSGIRVLTLRLKVTDNLPANMEGPQFGLSEIVTITIDEDADSYFEKEAAKDYESIRATLESTLADLQQTRKLTTPLQDTVKTDDPLKKEVTEKIDQTRQLAASAQEKLVELAEVL